MAPAEVSALKRYNPNVPWQADAAVGLGSAITSASCAAPIILTIDKAVV